MPEANWWTKYGTFRTSSLFIGINEAIPDKIAASPSDEEKDEDHAINPWEKHYRSKKLLRRHTTTRDRAYPYLMQLKVTDLWVICSEPHLSCKDDGWRLRWFLVYLCELAILCTTRVTMGKYIRYSSEDTIGTPSESQSAICWNPLTIIMDQLTGHNVAT